MATSPTFFSFARLPDELKLQIVTQAITDYLYERHVVTFRIQYGNLRSPHHSPLPAFFRVNRFFRYEAEKRLQTIPLFTHNYVKSSTEAWKLRHYWESPCVFFRSRDILHINVSSIYVWGLRDILKSLAPEVRSRVRHLHVSTKNQADEWVVRLGDLNFGERELSLPNLTFVTARTERLRYTESGERVPDHVTCTLYQFVDGPYAFSIREKVLVGKIVRKFGLFDQEGIVKFVQQVPVTP